MKHGHWDLAFAIVAIAISTGIFRFLAAPFGLQIFHISGALLVFNLIYVLGFFSEFRFNDRRRFLWAVLLLIWPLSTVLYSSGADLRSILVLLNSFLIFAGAVILISRGRMDVVRNILLVSITLTCIGVVLNLLQPNLFAETAQLANASELTMGRPGGFYLQPNDLAINIVLLYAAHLALGVNRSTMLAAGSLGLVVLIVLLSGSRAGVIIAGLVIVMDLIGRFFSSGSSMRMLRSSVWYLVIMAVASIGIFSFARSLVSILQKNSEAAPGGLVDRLDAFLSFRLSYDGSGLDTQSVRDRWDAQLAYIEKIQGSPIFGYGLGSEEHLLEAGSITLSSHSSFLSTTLEYGAVYSLILIATICSFLISRKYKYQQGGLNFSVRWTFVMLSLILMFYSGELLYRAPFLLFLALMVACRPRINCDKFRTRHSRMVEPLFNKVQPKTRLPFRRGTGAVKGS